MSDPPDARFALVPDAAKGAVADRPEVVLPAVASFMRGERVVEAAGRW